MVHFWMKGLKKILHLKIQAGKRPTNRCSIYVSTAAWRVNVR